MCIRARCLFIMVYTATFLLHLALLKSLDLCFVVPPPPPFTTTTPAIPVTLPPLMLSHAHTIYIKRSPFYDDSAFMGLLQLDRIEGGKILLKMHCNTYISEERRKRIAKTLFRIPDSNGVENEVGSFLFSRAVRRFTCKKTQKRIKITSVYPCCTLSVHLEKSS